MPYADPQKAKEAHKRWRDANRDKTRAWSAAWNATDEGKAKKAEWYRDNADVTKARASEWSSSNPERRAEIVRGSRAKNPDVYREINRRYREANPDRRQECFRNWCKDNPDKIRALKQKRRALQKGAEGFFTAEDIASIVERQGGKCAYCQKTRKLTVDHIIPLSKGGANWPDNICMACGSCNSKKKDRDLAEFVESLELLEAA